MVDTSLKEENQTKFTNGDKYLTFFLNSEYYGVNIQNVKEIIAFIKTTTVPKTPDFLEGVMNLRGNIIPIINLRKKFSMKNRPIDETTTIIILTIEGMDLGFIVDEVDEVINAEEEQYSEPPQFNPNINVELVSKTVRTQKSVAMILELEKLFTKEDFTLLEDFEKETLI